MFQLHNITSQGGRGRPAYPKPTERRVERVLDARGNEVGMVELKTADDGSVALVATVAGKSRTITFPVTVAKAKARKTAVRKATTKRTAKRVVKAAK